MAYEAWTYIDNDYRKLTQYYLTCTTRTRNHETVHRD